MRLKMRLLKLWRFEGVKEWLPLGIILAAALALRLIFFTGMVRGDALNYAHAAYALSNGGFDLDAWVGTSRVGLYFPVAALYAVFGPSEAATLFFPIFCSLLSIIFVYAIAKMHGGRSAGLVAALFWSFLALDVHLATSLLPDGPLTAFSTGAVYFLFISKEAAKPRKYYFLGVSLFLLVWAILIKPLALITLIFFGVIGLLQVWPSILKFLGRFEFEGKKERWFATLGLLVFLVFLLVYSLSQSRSMVITLVHANNDLASFLFTGATELDFGPTDFTVSNLFIYIAPLLLVAGLVLLRESKKELKPLLLWAAVVFIYYEWGTVSLNALTYSPIMPFKEARLLLFMLAPFVIFTAIYIGRNITSRFAQWAIPAISLSAVAIGWVSRPFFDQLTWAPWMSVSSSIAVIGAVLSPAIKRLGSLNLKMGLAIGYLSALCLAMLQPFLPYHALMFEDRSKVVEALRTALPFLNEHDDLPVVVQDKVDAMWLNYISEFELGYEWQNTQHVATPRIMVGSPAKDTSSYVIIGNQLSTIPLNWWQEISFLEEMPGRQGIFRTLSPQDSVVELADARIAFETDASLENLERLHGAATNALSWPELLRTWIELNEQLHCKYPFDEFAQRIIDYLNTRAGPTENNLFTNADFSSDLSGWDHSGSAQLDLDADSPTLIMQVESQADRLGQEVVLQPREFYVFRATIKTSPELLVGLLQVDNGHIRDSFSVSEVFGDFEQVIVIFATPSWDQAQTIRIDLFIPNGTGQIWIQEPSLSPLLIEVTD